MLSPMWTLHATILTHQAKFAHYAMLTQQYVKGNRPFSGLDLRVDPQERIHAWSTAWSKSMVREVIVPGSEPTGVLG